MTSSVKSAFVMLDLDPDSLRVHINGLSAAFPYDNTGGYENSEETRAATIKALKEVVNKL